MTSYPNCVEEWPEQWERLTSKQGDPTPQRKTKNGKTAEELESWADNCAGKIAYYLGKASGDGFWECKVHWFETRVASLREDASVLRKEGAPAKARVSHYSPYSVSDRPSILKGFGAIRPLYPPPPPPPLPFGARNPANTQAETEKMEKCFPPFRPPRKMVEDLSAYSISKNEEDEGKKQASKPIQNTPPSSPSQEE